ncbi:SPRY domain-containing protein [Wukongibacter baidiensis]|uniref:SPRY domain-containing protein n=1 Tax=Wukongibacter baidiensis TaxID=1723361 RepID=UPI003D7F94FB
MNVRKQGVYFTVALLMIALVFASSGSQIFAASLVTWDDSDKGSDVTLENNNLTVTIPNMRNGSKANVSKESGKWYWEIEINQTGYSMIGIANSDLSMNSPTYNTPNSRLYYSSGRTYPGGNTYGDAYSTNDVIGVALDLDIGAIEFYKNGISQGVAFSDISSLGEVFPYVTSGSSSGGAKMTANFGSTPFQYDIPEGFSPYNGEGSGQNSTSVLDIEPEKEKIKVNEKVFADLVIDNISEIAAEDIKIEYDEEKLEFLGFEEVDGMKLVKSIEETDNGELRVIIASEGEDNIVDNKEILLKLEFKGIKTGEALVDVTKGRVTDGIEMEKDLTDEECGEGTIIIEAMADVNNSGEFTLLDLGIDARHFSKDPESTELEDYNTDVVVNGEIDEDDLLEIAKYMLENPNYDPNN